MHIDRIRKTENIIKTTPEASLSSVLGVLSSSHDAAFIFDNGEFIGVINPYHSLIKTSYPPKTKVKKALMTPPKLEISEGIDRAIRLMIESKIHYLPVFENRRFIGIISARRILLNIYNDKKFSLPLSEHIKKARQLITIKESDPLSIAISLFKDYKTSKLIVIGARGTIVGVLSHYDVINYLSSPKERLSFASRKGDKSSILDKPVRNFAKKNVLTLRPENTFNEAIDLILSKQIGSVIIAGSDKKPLDILTTKDIFTRYLDRPITMPLSINMQHVSQQSMKIIKSFSQIFGNMLGNRKDVKEVEMTIREKKQGGVFETITAITQKGKKKQVIREEGKNLSKVLKDIKKRSKSLISKD